MKLAMFTPGLVASAIGRATRLVVHALLEQGHDVVVIRTEDIAHLDAPVHDFRTEVVNWNNAPRVELAVQEADMLVYQVGNNFQFHRGCMDWMPVYPGIVCLHDFFLGHLFHEWAQYQLPAAHALLDAWYGPEVAQRYFSLGGTHFIENTWDMAPMTEWICAMALGVVTHSSWAIDRVLRACPGPVSVIALPYDIHGLSQEAAHIGEPPAHEELSILTIGHINPNKRVDSVIRAISHSSMLRTTARYRLVGPIEPSMERELRELAAALNVKLEISGAVDDAELQQAISKADIVCCLRLPALEAASASAIESMLYGKPTVVMDTGFYRELPDQYVRKISAENEVHNLQGVLEELGKDKGRRLELGRQAARWAEQTFNAGKYAHGLIDICTSTSKAVPALATSRFYADTLFRWGMLDDETAMKYITLPLEMVSSPSSREVQNTAER